MLSLTPTSIALLLVVAITFSVLVIGAWRPILLRLGLRNIGRRRAQVAIAIAGLLVATSIIAGSLIVGDSFDASVRDIVISVLDHTDEMLVLEGQSGNLQFFDQDVHGSLLEAMATSMPHVDGLAARIEVTAPVQGVQSQLFRPRAVVIGFDPQQDLGEFHLTAGGRTTGMDAGPYEAYVNERLAEGIDVSGGEQLRVYFGTLPMDFTLKAVVKHQGRGAWSQDGIFVPLVTLQAILGHEGRINQVLISNVGGPAEGYLHTDQAVAEVHAALSQGHPYTLREIKKDRIAQAERGAKDLSQLFTLMGTFTVVAGLLLIVNIFSMLAEERKTEMGIERALGLKRRHLTFTFIAEGLVYALASSALGTGAGLGVAYVILWVFGQIFTASRIGFVFAVEAESLLISFSVGFLLTMVTVGLSSWRVSKLNIVRAIRDIPEPVPRRSTRQQLTIGAAMVGTGGILTYHGYGASLELPFMVGPSVLALGLGILVMRRVSPRTAFTGAGLFILFWLLAPLRIVDEDSVGIEAFVAIGLLLVLAGVIVVMFNSQVLLSALDRMASVRRKLPAVMRTAIAYPTNKRFRTGMTLAIFALIFFTITVMGLIMAMLNSSVEHQTLQQSGGYDILATSSGLPEGAVSWDNLSTGDLSGRVADFLGLTRGGALIQVPGLEGPLAVDLLGVDESFAGASRLTFYRMDPNYSSPEALWTAVMLDPNLAVVDRLSMPNDFGPSQVRVNAGVGDILEVASPVPGGEKRSLRVIGVLDQFLLQGIFLQAPAVASLLGAQNPTVFYFKASDAGEIRSLAHDLERTYLPYGMLALVIRDFVEDILKTTLSVIQLLQGFLALGLLVGIAGLGIIAMRNVVERRSETGALRALGFRRSMVLHAFLIEMTFIILLGLGIGVVLGILLSYTVYLEFFAGIARFEIPWANLTLIGVLAYFSAILATLSPGRRAASIPPAEALRRME